MCILVYKQTGLFHRLNSTESMDYVEKFVNDELVCVSLCDGSSSAFLGDTGRRIAANVAVKYAAKNYNYDCLPLDADSNFIKGLLNTILIRLKREIINHKGKDITISDMDTTCSLLILDKVHNCCIFISLGTEGLFALCHDYTIRMLAGSPEENSICNENRFISVTVRHDLNLYSTTFFMMSDGLWKGIYKGSSLIQPYKDHLETKQWSNTEKLIVNGTWFDDATIVIINL